MQNNQSNPITFQASLSFAFFIIVMNFLNPDAFIARRNIERYKSTGKIDIYYLVHLSDDAIPVIIGALNILDEDLRKSFARELYWRGQNNDFTYSSQWQSFNISRMRANNILNSNISELEPYKDYQQ